MNVQIDLGENIKDVVAEAVLRSLDEKKREALIQGAIAHLLTPRDGDARNNLSPIERAFRDAVTKLAEGLMEEEVNKPETRAKFQAVVQDAVTKALEQNREKTVEKISSAVYSALYNDGRY